VANTMTSSKKWHSENIDAIKDTLRKLYIVPSISTTGTSSSISYNNYMEMGWQLVKAIGPDPTVDVQDYYSRLQMENAQLNLENKMLKEVVSKFEERLTAIEESLSQEKVMTLRELSKSEAQREILNLFESGNTFYYSDIAGKLNLDLELVVDICNELEKAGKIQTNDDTV